ncbi:MAG: hypothetical protein A2X83_05860 [Desulfuromonadales bacterium GWD2_54_10]|nr:MAG: hypothetical protein A2X83_05860 [Desulfuromonadales bacterium GWD2_54_10]
MLNSLKFSSIICLLIISCVSSEVNASTNFLGAQIDIKSVPTSAWRIGITGFKPIVLIVNEKTQAKQLGFKPGDIIIGVDGIEIKSINELINLTAGTHKLKMLRKNSLEEIPIAIEEKKIAPKIVRDNNEQNMPQVKINDEVLENKYGKSEIKNKSKRVRYQQCMDNELANGNTYEYYVNNPNSRGGDYGRAQRICDEQFENRTGIAIERLY